MVSHIGMWRTNLKLQVWHYVINILLCFEPEVTKFGREGGAGLGRICIAMLLS